MPVSKVYFRLKKSGLGILKSFNLYEFMGFIGAKFTLLSLKKSSMGTMIDEPINNMQHSNKNEKYAIDHYLEVGGKKIK